MLCNDCKIEIIKRQRDTCKDGKYRCKKCSQKKRDKFYRENNIEKFKQKDRNYYLNNKEKVIEYKRKWIIENRDKHNQHGKEWREKNPRYLYNYRKKKLETDINFKLSEYLRTRTREALKGDQKSGSAVRDLGCSIQELKEYLEKQFQEGMTWENRGKIGWHLDHIIPLSSFDLTDREQFLKACHYTNLQPLWAKDNLKKWCKIE